MAEQQRGAPQACGPLWQQGVLRGLAAIPTDGWRQLRSLSPSTAARLRPAAGPALLDLASNDYLGLAQHQSVMAAARQAIGAEGVGAGGSRLVTGTRPVHTTLERQLACWLGRERALLFPSGFQANLAAVTGLADRRSLVLADRLVHHSLLLGVRASGAQLNRFRHNDLNDLEHRLGRARRSDADRRLVVLSESLFSMQGTSPAVAELAALCAAHDAALVLDEAHALGILGPGGRGLGHGLAPIALISGTFGKAFGSGGAFLAGDAVTIEWLLQSSGAFRYTTALAPPLAAAALAALGEIQQRDPGPALLERARRWRQGLEAAGWPRPAGEGPILPLLVGEAGAALALQARLEAAGLLAVAIRPPTVPRGTARLRLVLRHDLPQGSLKRLLRALGPPPPMRPCK